MRLRWSESASNDILAIFEYLIDKNPRAAFSETEKITNTVKLLEDMPRIGVETSKGQFYKVVDGAKFTIFYFLNEKRGVVSIVRVLSQSQQLAEYRGDETSPFDLMN